MRTLWWHVENKDRAVVSLTGQVTCLLRDGSMSRQTDRQAHRQTGETNRDTDRQTIISNSDVWRCLPGDKKYTADKDRQGDMNTC